MNEFFVVYFAEITRKLKSRPFQIGLLLGIIGIYGFIKLPVWISNAVANAKTLVLAGDPSLVARAKPLLAGDFTIEATLQGTGMPTDSQVSAHRGATWVVLSSDAQGLRLTLYAENPGNIAKEKIVNDLIPLNLQLATNVSQTRTKALLDIPTIVKGLNTSKFRSERTAQASQTIAFTLLFFLYLLITFNSQLLMSSVAEEKTSRIAELLVASISPIPLLYGKIASSATVGLIQMVAWIVEAVIAGRAVTFTRAQAAAQTLPVHTGTPSLAGIFAGSITSFEIFAFLIFFALGFLQLSMLFAAAGSLINRTEDLGSISFPLIVPVMAGFVTSIVALATPDAPWVIVTSFTPLLAPFVMFARIAVSNVPVWQVVVSIVINTLALWLIAIVAGKLYRVGMLLYGQPPSFRQIWSVIKS